MEDNKTIEDYKKELDKTNKLINTKTTNLIYLLKNCNIEDINILNYHYTFIKLINKRDYLEQIIFDRQY